jgi:hypothetical protein
MTIQAFAFRRFLKCSKSFMQATLATDDDWPWGIAFLDELP